MGNEYPQWKMKGHTGGFSDDRFIGIRDSFAYAKGVEIRKNPHSLTLAYAVEKNSGNVITDLINAMVTISTTGDIIAFGNAGNIYRRAEGAGDWVKVYTMSSTDSILNAIEYNGYLYWFTYNKIHRIAVPAIDADWSAGATPTIDYKTFTNSNLYAHPAIELNNKLYIGDSFYLAELDSFGTFTGNKLSIFHDEEIRALTFGGSMMRIFSRKSTKVEGGHKYFWDGTSESYTERVPFVQVIHTAISNGGDDYVIAGRRPYIYNASGYSWQKLKKLPGVTDAQSCYLSPNSLDFYDDLLCIGAAESGTNSLGRGVWTYGQYDYKYPMSLNFDYPTSNDNTTDIIGCVHNSNGVLYFSWKNGTSYGIDIVNTAKYRATGELHSIVHYGEESDETKCAMAIKASYDTLAAGEKIEVFAKKDLAASFPETAEITIEYSNAADLAAHDKRHDTPMIAGDYNFLETKVVLTAGTNGATTPEIIELSILFDTDVEIGDND